MQRYGQNKFFFVKNDEKHEQNAVKLIKNAYICCLIV